MTRPGIAHALGVDVAGRGSRRGPSTAASSARYGHPHAAEHVQDRDGHGDRRCRAARRAARRRRRRPSTRRTPSAAGSRAGAVPGMSASESDAAITTEASTGWGRLRSSPGTNSSIATMASGADHAGQLRLGPGLLGHRGARAAGADREALEQAGGQVGGADADHLLVGVDLLAGAGGEGRGGGDGVGERDQGDAERAGRPAAPGRRARCPGTVNGGKPCGQRRRPARRPRLAEVERHRHRDRPHHGHEHAGDLRAPPVAGPG